MTRFNRSMYIAAAVAALGLSACASNYDRDGTDVVHEGQSSGSDTDRSTAQTMDDSTITMKVAAKLTASGDVDKKDINVQTYNGVVQLSGFADNQREKDRAGEIARTVDGVRSVKNNITAKGG